MKSLIVQSAIHINIKVNDKLVIIILWSQNKPTSAAPWPLAKIRLFVHCATILTWRYVTRHPSWSYTATCTTFQHKFGLSMCLVINMLCVKFKLEKKFTSDIAHTVDIQIGHVHIGIFFSFIGNSQWSLLALLHRQNHELWAIKSNSDWLFNT